MITQTPQQIWLIIAGMAIVAPLVLWPEATGGQPDPARLSAALVTIILGSLTRNTLIAIFGGGVTLFGLLYLIG
ncbi:MAG: AzlD domain-containing protein [Maritimibacter sp.]